MEDIPIDVFLSHANSEKDKAAALKKGLENESMRVFLAHDDIDGGEEWMKALYQNAKDCDVFVILLSKKYHEANYTDQETGIAFAFDKPMIPISLDGTTPYGFMSKYQAIKAVYPFDHDKIEEIENLILVYTQQGQKLINTIIDHFRESGSFSVANATARMLFSYKKFSTQQLNTIAKAFMENSQIHGGWNAQPLAQDCLYENFKKLDPTIQKELKEFLR